MNQWIKIHYMLKPFPNYWDFWFYLNGKIHRKKVPSAINSEGDWEWWFQGELRKEGHDFNWSEE